MYMDSDRKIDLLHQQIDDLTKESSNRTELIDKLQRISSNEEERRLKVLERNRFDPSHITPRRDVYFPSSLRNPYFPTRVDNPQTDRSRAKLKDELRLNLGTLGNDDTSKGRMINDEMDRLYGKPTARSYREMFDPKRVVEDIINKRTHEYSVSQKDKAFENQALAVERFKLQEARENIRHKRLALENAVSPVGRAKSLPVGDDDVVEHPALTAPLMEREQARSVDSYIKQVKENYPDNLDRVYELRKKVEDDYNERWRPYRGEAGITTFDNTQLREYYEVRGVVDDYVEKELDTYLDGNDNIIDTNVRNALLDAEEKHKLEHALSTSEEKAVKLMAEDVLLETTSEEIYNTAKEILHVAGILKNSSDQLFMKVVEATSTDNPDGRDIGDPLYNRVTNVYFDLQSRRNYKGKESWSHNNSTQFASTANASSSESSYW